jgi:perosamine synthetase
MNQNFSGPEIPWWSVLHTSSELPLLKEVIQSNYLNEGEFVEKFENKIKEILGVRYVIACTSGTTALFLALKACGIKPGDLVAVPNLTFVATANAVKLAGAEPVLIDVCKETLTICPDQLMEAGKKHAIKAVIPVHVSGRSAFKNGLIEVCKKLKLKIIEDAAEAFGSMDPFIKQKLGTIGNAGAFSFSPNKIVTSGQGGVVVTNDENIARRVTQLKDQGRPTRGTGGADIHANEGYNFKFTNLQAAVGLAQLGEFDSRKEHLINVNKHYQANFLDCKHQFMPKFDVANGEFPLWPEIYSKNRKGLISKLVVKKIGYREIWFPLSSQRIHSKLKFQGYKNSLDVSKHTIWLPSSFKLSETSLNIISKSLKCELCSNE